MNSVHSADPSRIPMNPLTWRPKLNRLPRSCKGMPVDPTFLDLVNYGICRALNERLGKEATEQIFREVGRICYRRARDQGMIEGKEDPLDALVEVARFLERMGYMERIVISRVSEDELLLDMYGVSVLRSSIELVDSGMAPSHYMTNMMFAALEEHGVTAELVDLGFDPEENHVREKWILKR